MKIGLVAMSGVIVGCSTFNLLKAYYISEHRMRSLALWGRGGQFAAIGLAGALAGLAPWAPEYALAVGLSASYLVGCAGLLAALRRPKEGKSVRRPVTEVGGVVKPASHFPRAVKPHDCTPSNLP